MPTGKVKFFDKRKGFGFIVRDDGGRDVYVNISDIPSGVPLEDGEKVKFEVVQEPRGPRAKNVEVIEE